MTRVERLSALDQARIVLARLYVRLGWPGMLGLAMAAMALGLGAWVVHQQQALASNLSISPTKVDSSAQVPATSERTNVATPPTLPRAEEQIEILKRIKAQVVSAGLAWPKADYKLVRLSDENLARLEVHTTLKGPYPKLRQLITTLLNKEPALALRELSLQRPNADNPDVEAKIQFVVFLANDWPPANGADAP